MRNRFKADLAISMLLLAVIIAFAFAYNSLVTERLTDLIYNHQDVLTSYNNEIIVKLTAADSTDEWSGIIEDYPDLVVAVENANHKVVVRSANRSASALDVRVRTSFDYRGQVYLVVSSVYLQRNYKEDNREMIRSLFVEFLIAFAALYFLIFITYTFVTRPYRNFYYAMEDYERTGKLGKYRFKGYVGKIYNRFVSLTKHLETEQENQQRIIASISHDLKTPLTSILGYAERLQKDELPPERQRQYLETIYDKAQQIQALMDVFDEYLGYKMMAEPELVAMPTETGCACLLRDYAPDLELMGVTFEVNNYAENETVLLDRMRMRRVFGNLVSNSLKHLSDRPGRIVVDIFSDKEHILINFSDNGAGVPADKLELIFEPLYTSDEGRKVAGLGLSICQEIVESLGGTICAKPSMLGGLCISMTLKKGGKHDHVAAEASV